MQVSIEKYQDKDFKEVISLLVRSFKSKFLHRQNLDQGDIENILYSVWDIKADDPGYFHFVAKVNEKIVGVILIQCGPILRNQKKIPFFRLSRQYGLLNMLILLFKLHLLETSASQACYIEHIAVDKSMRGKGIGEQLISHCEKILIKMNYHTLTLAVAVDNPAKHLYNRMGFQDVERINDRLKEFFIGMGQWIIMKKPLISNHDAICVEKMKPR